MLNIKNPKTHALAQRVADLTGETMTEAVTTALRERLEKLEREPRFDEARYLRLKALAAGSRELWREPYLSAGHGDLLYDERGLPK